MMVFQESQRGFVLAVVLWSIAALTLIAGGIMAQVNNTLNQAYSMREHARLQQNLMATEQTLLYLLSARPHNPAGIDLSAGSVNENDQGSPFDVTNQGEFYGPTLRLDGTWYPGIGRSGFALQDAGATVSLLEPRRESWLRLMNLLNVPEAEADTWYDQVMDYQDRDQLERLNGSEREGYRERGLEPPPDRFFVSPFEIRNLPIAKDHPEIASELIRVTTIGTGSVSNLNTSPPLMLQLVHYLSKEDAVNVAAERGGRVINSLTEASSQFGVLFQGGQFETLWQPSGNIRVMLGDREGRHKRWIEVKFTATANGAPWLVEYSHPVTMNQTEQEPDTTDAFSQPSTTDTSTRALDWAYYPAFFPRELPVER